MASLSYVFRGSRVVIPRAADIARDMHPGGRYSAYVQAVLKDMEWIDSDPSQIETMEFSVRIMPMVVEVQHGVPRIWGIHAGHKARIPQNSPFVVQNVEPKDIGCITVELVGEPNAPVLVRAYGGEYAPPLPWMMSAKNADGGVAECCKFWRKHAYLLNNLTLIKPGTITYDGVPHWYRATPK